MKRRFPLHHDDVSIQGSASPITPLFPETLFRAASTPLSSVADLVQEQQELLARHHLRVVEARSYLRTPPRRFRSPPRRLQVIQEGFQTPSTMQGKGGMPPVQQDVITNASEHHPPLRSRQSLPSLQAGGGAQSPQTQTSSTPGADNPAPTALPDVQELAAAVSEQWVNSFLEVLKAKGTRVLETTDGKHTITEVDAQMNDNGRRTSPSGDPRVALVPLIPRLVKRHVLRFSSQEAERHDDLTDGGIDDNSDGPLVWHPKSFCGAVALLAVDGCDQVIASIGSVQGAAPAVAAVNDFYRQVLQVVVQEFNGDIIQLTHDGIWVMWTADDGSGDGDEGLSPAVAAARSKLTVTVADCCRIATSCAVSLHQKKLSIVEVPCTGGLTLSLRIAIASGKLDAEVVRFYAHGAASNSTRALGWATAAHSSAPSISDTQCPSLTHVIRGAPLVEVLHIITAANVRETCVSISVRESLAGCTSGVNIKTTEIMIPDVKQMSHSGRVDGHHSGFGGEAIVHRVSQTVPLHPSEVCFRVDRFDFDARSTTQKSRNSECSDRGMSTTTERLDHRQNDSQLASSLPYFVHQALLPSLYDAINRGTFSSTLASTHFAAVLHLQWAPKNNNTSLATWYFEIMCVLEQHGAAVVRCCDDRNGFFCVAVCGTLRPERDPCLVAVRIAMCLLERESQCRVSIAAGTVISCLVGAQNLAWRWNVSGAPCVNSFSLLQSLANCMNRGSVGCIIDESVWDAIGKRALLAPCSALVRDGIANVYTLAQGAACDAQPAWLLEAVPHTFCDACHVFRRKDLRDFVDQRLAAGATRLVAVVAGPPGIGKATVCVAVAQQLLMTPALHECSPQDVVKPLEIARTLAEWFSTYHHHPELITFAQALRASFTHQHHMKTREILVELLCAAEKARVRTVVIVKQAQWLDPMSVAFLTQLLKTNATDESHSQSTTFLLSSESAPFYSTVATEESGPAFAQTTSDVAAQRSTIVGAPHAPTAVTWDTSAVDVEVMRPRKRRGSSFSGNIGLGATVVLLCVTPTYGAPSPVKLLQKIRYLDPHDPPSMANVMGVNTLSVVLTPLLPDVTRELVTRWVGWELDPISANTVINVSQGIPALVPAVCQHLRMQWPEIFDSQHVSCDGVVSLTAAATSALGRPMAWMHMSVKQCATWRVHYDAIPYSLKYFLMVITALTCENRAAIYVDVVSHVVVATSRPAGTRNERIKSTAQQLMLEESYRTLEDLGFIARRVAPQCTTVDGWRRALERSESNDENDKMKREQKVKFSTVVSVASPALLDYLHHSELEPDRYRNILRAARRFLVATLGGGLQSGASGIATSPSAPPPWVCPLHLAVRYIQFRVASGDSSLSAVALAQRILRSMPSSVSGKTVATGSDEIEINLDGVVISLPLCTGEHNEDDFRSCRCAIQAELGGWNHRLFDETSGDDKGVASSSIIINQTRITIPPSVFMLHNLIPPISLGFTPLSILGDLCLWFKNASTTIARKRSIPEKAMERGRAIVVGLMDALRRLTPVADMIQKERNAEGNNPSVALAASQFLPAELEADEAALTRLSEGVIRLKGHTSSAQDAMAQILNDFVEFLNTRLVAKARVFEQYSIVVFRSIAGDDGEGIGSRASLNRMDAARRISVEALLRALRLLLPLFASKEIGRSNHVEETLSVHSRELLIQQSLTMLAISEFNTRSSRFSIPWLRDRLLSARQGGGGENVGGDNPLRSFLACLVASYLSLTTASGRASVVLSSDLAARH